MYDNDRRLADHFGGKLHIGFVTIREKINQLEVGPVFSMDVPRRKLSVFVVVLRRTR